MKLSENRTLRMLSVLLLLLAVLPVCRFPAAQAEEMQDNESLTADPGWSGTVLDLPGYYAALNVCDKEEDAELRVDGYRYVLRRVLNYAEAMLPEDTYEALRAESFDLLPDGQPTDTDAIRVMVNMILEEHIRPILPDVKLDAIPDGWYWARSVGNCCNWPEERGKFRFLQIREYWSRDIPVFETANIFWLDLTDTVYRHDPELGCCSETYDSFASMIEVYPAMHFSCDPATASTLLRIHMKDGMVTEIRAEYLP